MTDVFKMMTDVFKTMNDVFKTMNFVFKMMNDVLSQNDEWCIKSKWWLMYSKWWLMYSKRWILYWIYQVRSTQWLTDMGYIYVHTGRIYMLWNWWISTRNDGIRTETDGFYNKQVYAYGAASYEAWRRLLGLAGRFGTFYWKCREYRSRYSKIYNLENTPEKWWFSIEKWHLYCNSR